MSIIEMLEPFMEDEQIVFRKFETNGEWTHVTMVYSQRHTDWREPRMFISDIPIEEATDARIAHEIREARGRPVPELAAIGRRPESRGISASHDE